MRSFFIILGFSALSCSAAFALDLHQIPGVGSFESGKVEDCKNPNPCSEKGHDHNTNGKGTCHEQSAPHMFCVYQWKGLWKAYRRIEADKFCGHDFYWGGKALMCAHWAEYKARYLTPQVATKQHDGLQGGGECQKDCGGGKLAQQDPPAEPKLETLADLDPPTVPTDLGNHTEIAAREEIDNARKLIGSESSAAEAIFAAGGEDSASKNKKNDNARSGAGGGSNSSSNSAKGTDSDFAKGLPAGPGGLQGANSGDGFNMNVAVNAAGADDAEAKDKNALGTGMAGDAVNGAFEGGSAPGAGRGYLAGDAGTGMNEYDQGASGSGGPGSRSLSSTGDEFGVHSKGNKSIFEIVTGRYEAVTLRMIHGN